MTVTFARVDPETLEVTLKYNTNGGAKWAEGDLPCEIPFEILADHAVRDTETDQITLVEDPQKVQAKLDQAWSQVRQQRDALLAQSDWTVTAPDAPESIQAQRAQWLEYRQALRDITMQSDPFQIVWPLKP